MLVSVVTQIKKVLEQEAGYLRLRTSEGDIGIMPNHAPLVAELSAGKMEIESPSKDRRDVYFLTGGFLEKINIENEQLELEKLRKELELDLPEEEKQKIQKRIKISSAMIDAKTN